MGSAGLAASRPARPIPFRTHHGQRHPVPSPRPYRLSGPGGGIPLTHIEFHLQLNQNETWNMSRLHFHNYYELLLPLTSPGNIFVNDQVYPLRRGTLYLIGENTLHRTMSTGSHARYVLHISRRTLTELSTPQTDFTRLTQDSFRRADLNREELSEIVELFQALERNKNDGSFGSDIYQVVALLNLLIRISPVLNAATAGESIRNKDFLRVSPILDYIRDKLSEPLSLDQIAGQFYISKHYLCRIFKSATGFSVMEYIIYSRVLKARQLLQEGVSVQQAGELSGFSDNSHFIRTFGHLTGLTPGKYAKEYQSGDQVLLGENVKGK